MFNLKSQNDNLNLKTNLRYRSYQFSLQTINLVKSFPEKKIYWIMEDQLLRAATSVGANLIEAKSSSSRRDFIKYYEIALKSANETEYWLNLLSDSQLVKSKYLDLLVIEIKEISRMIASSIITLKGKRISS